MVCCHSEESPCRETPEDEVLRDSPTGCKGRRSPEVNFKGIRGKELFRSFQGFL